MANPLISQLDVYGPGHCPKLSVWLCDPVGEDEECSYIFSSSWGVGRTVGLVAESDVDRKMILTCSVQLYRSYLVKGTEVVDEMTFFAIEQGPSSKRSPVDDEQLGPPFNQRG